MTLVEVEELVNEFYTVMEPVHNKYNTESYNKDRDGFAEWLKSRTGEMSIAMSIILDMGHKGIVERIRRRTDPTYRAVKEAPVLSLLRRAILQDLNFLGTGGLLGSKGTSEITKDEARMILRKKYVKDFNYVKINDEQGSQIQQEQVKVVSSTLQVSGTNG